MSGTADAVVCGAEVSAGHDGRAEVVLALRHGNGAESRLRLEADEAFRVLEAAIKKLTLDPATIWGLRERGALREGFAADVVVFDPDAIDRGPEVAWTPEGGYSDARPGVIAG